jgi:hypothetical protein
MYKRRLLKVAPYLLAFFLTTVIVIPQITSAQDDGPLPEDTTSAEVSVGWRKDGRNVYIKNANVGIGDRPESFKDIQLQITRPNGDVGLLLKTPNDRVGSIYFRERDLNNGFTISYDGGVPNPVDSSSSGLFGIWRVDGAETGAPPLFSAYRHSDNVGIGSVPSDRADVRLKVGGHQLVRGPGNWVGEGESARVYLGDYSHWIQAVYGTGIQINPSQAPNPVTFHERTGYVGIGTTTPRALLEIAGDSGIAGLHLSLSESQENLSGHVNSPMIKWDSTAYPGVDKIWYSRAQGNEWVLSSSGPNYEDVDTIIRVKPDGEICLGSGC